MHIILSILSHPIDFSQITHMISVSTARSTMWDQPFLFPRKKKRWFLLRFTKAPSIKTMARACTSSIWKLAHENACRLTANKLFFSPRISWIWIKRMGVLKWRRKNKSELRKLIILPLGLSNMSDLFTKVANIFQILDVWYSYKERHSGLQHD